MTASMFFVILGNLIFVVACGAIGFRLLRLGFRTRQVQETLLGAGFLFMVLGIPLLGMSGLGRAVVSEVRLVPLIEGLVCLGLSVACISGFVWRTFHPANRWLLAIPVVLGVSEVAIAFELVGLLEAAAPGELASAVVRDTIMSTRYPMTFTFAWMAFEGTRQYRAAVKRDALGIGNAIVTNRFLLFALAGGFAAANTLVSTILHSYGMTPFAHPAAAACFATGSISGGTTLFLAFVPPARYIAWVNSRSEGLATA